MKTYADNGNKNCKTSRNTYDLPLAKFSVQPKSFSSYSVYKQYLTKPITLGFFGHFHHFDIQDTSLFLWSLPQWPQLCKYNTIGTNVISSKNFATCNVSMNPPGGRQMQFPLHLVRTLLPYNKSVRNSNENSSIQFNHTYSMIKELISYDLHKYFIRNINGNCKIAKQSL